jgi:hypothetical protein
MFERREEHVGAYRGEGQEKAFFSFFFLFFCKCFGGPLNYFNCFVTLGRGTVPESFTWFFYLRLILLFGSFTHVLTKIRE